MKRKFFWIFFLYFSQLLPSELFGQRRVYNCLDFDGVNDVVRTKATSTVTNLNKKPITVEAWINPTSFAAAADEACVVARYQDAGNRGFFLGVGGTGQLFFSINDDSTASITSEANVIPLNKWTHVAGTFDRYCLRIYINGQFKDSLIDSTAIGDASGTPFTMGNTHSLSRPYWGKIDEVRIWSRAMSSAELAAMYNRSYCGFSSDLMAYYRFNRGNLSGNNSVFFRLPDWSLYNQEATLYNFQLSGSTSNYVPGIRVAQEVISTVDTVTACDSYRSPSRLFTYTQSGIYYDTVYSQLGCDSALKIVLTIKKSSRDTLYIRSCNAYVFPSGTGSANVSGVYTDIIKNSANCDSILTLYIKIGADSTFVDTTVCAAFQLPQRGVKYSVSGTYVDTLINVYGCDSLIFYRVEILPVSRRTVSVAFCDSTYLSTSNRWIYDSGKYSDTLVNFLGCDSIIEYDIKSNSTRAVFTDYACGSYVSPSAKYIWTRSGTWYDTLVNVKGCDSIIEVRLEVSPVTDTVLFIQACGSYRVPSRRYLIKNSGLYYDTLMNAWGCDSIIKIDAKIIHFETDLEESEDSLIAMKGYDSYQWLRCDQNFEVISGENNHFIKTNEVGEYAVRMEFQGCADTSECVTIAQNGVSVFQNVDFQAFPNPNNGIFYIDGKNLEASFVEVRDFSGRIHQVISFMDGFDGKREVRILEPGGYYLILFKGSYKEVISIFVNP